MFPLHIPLAGTEHQACLIGKGGEHFGGMAENIRRVGTGMLKIDGNGVHLMAGEGGYL